MIDYSTYNFLVVDDFPQFRRAIRQMVEFLGGTNFDLTATGLEASKAIAKKSYDIVLCDYNLGEGKNGQQVLEEARHLRHLSAGNLFVMLTAENTIEMVMGALEVSPDDYLTKPFNKVMLQNRLDKLIERNLEMEKVHRALDRDLDENAVMELDKLIRAKSRHRLYCLKLQSQLLIKLEDYSSAMDVYEVFPKDRLVPWVSLGIGKVHFLEGRYAKAQLAFESLLEQNEAYIEAYDWLAKTQEKLGEVGEAQHTLERAIERSPRGVKRQMQLGRLAVANGDNDRATKAFRSSVNLGEHSCHRASGNYIGLAKSLVKKSTDSNGGMTANRAVMEALDTMNKVRETYAKDNEVLLQSRMVDGQAFQSVGKENEAKEALGKAFKIYQKMDGKVKGDIGEELSSALEQQGMEEEAEQVSDRISEVSEKRQSVESDVVQENEVQAAAAAKEAAAKEDASPLNDRGVELYNEGKIKEAVAIFKEAADEKRKSISINLNAVQTAIQFMEQSQVDPDLLKDCETFFRRVRNIEEKDKRYKRYLALKDKFSNLTASKK